MPGTGQLTFSPIFTPRKAVRRRLGDLIARGGETKGITQL